MQIIDILIAEDTKSDIKIYNDAIDDFNRSNTEFNFYHIVCETKDEALKQIHNKNFDAAFIDLNLSKTADDEGKELITAIQDNTRYPIYIVSGQIQKIDHEFNNKFISKHDKDDVVTDDLLEEICSIYKTGITKVLGAKGILENCLDNIFWNHFSESKEHWLNHKLHGEELEKTISRYTLTHLLEYLHLNDDGTEIKNVDPAEMYIKPNVKDTLYPGTILKKGSSKYLVLSPACDIAQGNCACVTLIKLTELFYHEDIKNLNESMLQLKQNINELKKTNIDLESEIKSKIDSDLLGQFKENLIDYQKIKNATIKNSIDEFEKSFISEFDGNKLSEVRKNILDMHKQSEKLKKLENQLKNLLRQFITNNKGNRYYFLPKFLDFKAKVADFQDIVTVDISEIGQYNKIMNISLPFIKDIQSKFSSYYARQGSPDFDFSSMTEQYYDSFMEN
ncbi:hypothetical protein CRU99_03470 [Malaciobacter mytili]|uniref:response regulator n=1 Tax=Malaciobacter mytili TaxID=603050 RepID=UPI00100B36DE|nr:response regulator [Malaciobacter mytili]RXI45768.1 hypothetical protein CRU99_03470 [Malaciobacter mytili]